ncbi:MAG: hypothetical protein SOT35_01425 [Bullifex sp.]|nr:hypothetical protein [Bullifex sp.]
MIFIVMMVCGLGCLCAVLSVIASRLEKPWLTVLFALSFVFALAMGYLSGKDSHSAVVNWIEEGTNMLSQGLLMLGVMLLHKHGLSRIRFTEES